MLLERGILYTACGPPYIRQAAVSARSAKRFMPDIPIALFTDESESNVRETYDCFDKVVPIRPSEASANQYMLDRLRSLTQTPFSQTLALDTDTFILDDLTEIFSILTKFDVALCHGHQRVLRHEQAKEDGKLDPNIPYSFAPVNGGLVLFGSSDGARTFVNSLLDLYQAKQYYDDQVAMRELLWTGDFKYCILPREYNFYDLSDVLQWSKWGFLAARPKIFHYSLNKDQDVAALMEPLLKRLTKDCRSLSDRLEWRWARYRYRRLAGS